MKYNLDIIEKESPFVNIEIDEDKFLISAYENGKITRRLFYINKEQLELLIKGLQSTLSLL